MISRPVSPANFASSFFQARFRVPLEEPASAGDQQPGRARVGIAAQEVPPAGAATPRRTRRCSRQCRRSRSRRSRPCRRCRRGSRARLVPARERVVQHLRRAARGVPFAPGLRVVPDLLLLLGVHADDRVPGGLAVTGLGGDVAELGVPVRVVGALRSSWRWLQAEALGAQQLVRRVRATPGGPGGPARPPASASDLMVHRSGDIGYPAGRVGDQAPAARGAARDRYRRAASRPPPGRRARPGGSCRSPAPGLPATPCPHGPRQPRGHQPDPAMTQRPRLSTQHQPPLPLIRCGKTDPNFAASISRVTTKSPIAHSMPAHSKTTSYISTRTWNHHGGASLWPGPRRLSTRRFPWPRLVPFPGRR